MAYKTVLTLLIVTFASGTPQKTSVSPANPKCVNEKERCVVITDCQYALKLIDEFKLNRSVAVTLRDMHCGFNATKPMVCCPEASSNHAIVYTSEETATKRPKPKPSMPPKRIKPLQAALISGGAEEISSDTESPAIFDPFPDRKICGQVTESDRIFGGSVTNIDEFPWMARIKYAFNDPSKGFQYICTASLVTDRHLISAAHCLSNINHEAVSVRLGEWNTESPSDCFEEADGGITCPDPPVEVEIEEVFRHEKFDRRNITYGDIAIIKLKKPVNFTGKNSLLASKKILLLEGGADKRFVLTPEYSNRVVALNQNTKSLMSSLYVWRNVESMRLQPVRHMQVWDACSEALISFSSSDILDDDVAYIVENDVLMEAISTELRSSAVKNVDIVYGAKIAGYELQKTGDSSKVNVVEMESGDTYICDLLIGADGAKSKVREAMGVQYVSWNYDQMGVVATLHLAEETENTTAWQRFLPTGPVALLPLDAARSSLVWSMTGAQAKELLNLPEERFVDALNDALWKQYPRSPTVDACVSWVGSLLQRAGLPDGAQRQLPPSVRAIAPGSRAAFPLGFGHSTRYVAPGVALVGDAAHRVHPLAGQGVNLGFGDIKDLTQFLSDALYTGLDITHPSWLSKYESSRQRHNVPTQLAVDALYRLYALELPPVVLARSVGLQLTNALHPIKKLIMSHATT